VQQPAKIRRWAGGGSVSGRQSRRQLRHGEAFADPLEKAFLPVFRRFAERVGAIGPLENFGRVPGKPLGEVVYRVRASPIASHRPGEGPQA
jgi:hypothetical protein